MQKAEQQQKILELELKLEQLKKENLTASKSFDDSSKKSLDDSSKKSEAKALATGLANMPPSPTTATTDQTERHLKQKKKRRHKERNLMQIIS